MKVSCLLSVKSNTAKQHYKESHTIDLPFIQIDKYETGWMGWLKSHSMSCHAVPFSTHVKKLKNIKMKKYGSSQSPDLKKIYSFFRYFENKLFYRVS